MLHQRQLVGLLRQSLDLVPLTVIVPRREAGQVVEDAR